jgi:putative lipase involved disintegration of autophagic bodies
LYNNFQFSIFFVFCFLFLFLFIINYVYIYIYIYISKTYNRGHVERLRTCKIVYIHHTSIPNLLFARSNITHEAISPTKVFSKIERFFLITYSTVITTTTFTTANISLLVSIKLDGSNNFLWISQ